MDPYKILGIGKEASLEEISAAYREKSKKHHPDKGGDTWAFQQVQQAYEKIKKERGEQRAGDQHDPKPAPEPSQAPEPQAKQNPPMGEAVDGTGVGFEEPAVHATRTYARRRKKGDKVFIAGVALALVGALLAFRILSSLKSPTSTASVANDAEQPEPIKLKTPVDTNVPTVDHETTVQPQATAQPPQDMVQSAEATAIIPADASKPKLPAPTPTVRNLVLSNLEEAVHGKSAIDLLTQAEAVEVHAERFVLLDAAKEKFIEIGDAEQAIGVIEQMAQQFDFDDLQAKAEALYVVAGWRDADTNYDLEQLDLRTAQVIAEQGLRAATNAASAERDDLTEILNRLALAAARACNNTDLETQVALSIYRTRQRQRGTSPREDGP